MRSRLPLTSSPHARSGLSVVEVLVALMLVSVGLLGLAGSSALALRMATSAARERRAAQRAAARIARLSAEGCARATAGSRDDESGALREQWSVDRQRGEVVRLSASVGWATPRGVRTITVESALLC
jgi:Tfp pilus assembly protein PilV